MKAYELDRIYWGDVTASETYLYGSVIDYFDKTVVFENLTFASGKVIKLWRSRTHYQHHRRIPELPLLYGGQTYHLEPVMTTTPSARAYFQVTYFNRQNEQIGFDILREDKLDFTYPKDAFTYTIGLVNGGCQSLTFSHFTLSENKGTYQALQIPSDKTTYYLDKDLPSDLRFVKGLLEKR